MSKIVERGLEAVQNSEFQWVRENQLEIKDAYIFWTNFRGEANKFGSKTRTFNVAITKEVAEELDARGWKVRESGDPETGILYFVNIKVNMNSSYPPVVTLFTKFRNKKNRRALDIDSIGELDRTIIESADCIINSFESKQYPGKVSGYLKTLFVIQDPDVEFGGKYDDWMDEDETFDENLDE